MCLHIKIMITLKITLVLKELDSVLKYHIIESIEPRSMHGSRALIGGGGGCIFIYSGSARLILLKSTLFQKN